MLPKRIKQETASRILEDNQQINLSNKILVNQSQPNSKKKDGSFKCHCGKSYGSLAAVHTHINNKHPEQKKKYKNLIVNPRKIGQGPSTSIRMKDINFPQKQAELMCLADNTVKNIYQYMKCAYDSKGQKLDILLDDDDLGSDSELDSDQIQGIKQSQKRAAAIKEQIEKLYQQFNIAQLKEFKPFKIQKFTLSLVKELTKYFKPVVAAKIQIQIHIAAARRHQIQSNLLTNIERCEESLWGGVQKMIQIISSYYKGWMRVVNMPSHPK